MKTNPTLAILFFSTLLLSACLSSQKNKELSPEMQRDLIIKGKTITQQSFQALSTELSRALQEGGFQHAVSYCHLQASPIIDSLSKANNAKIYRKSDRFRNPLNQPDNLDLTVLEAYRQQLAEGREVQPHLEKSGNTIMFYAPIVIQNPMCLLCHGESGITIEQPTFDFIKSKYPEDRATGYKLGDLRGVWKVVFDEE